MHISPYVISVSFLGLFFVIDRLLKFLRREPRQSLFKLISIVAMWIIIIMIIAVPSSVKKLLHIIGADTNINTLIFIGFLLVMLTFLRLLSIIEKLERDITHLVREEAVRDFRSSQKVRKK